MTDQKPKVALLFNDNTLRLSDELVKKLKEICFKVDIRRPRTHSAQDPELEELVEADVCVLYSNLNDKSINPDNSCDFAYFVGATRFEKPAILFRISDAGETAKTTHSQGNPTVRRLAAMSGEEVIYTKEKSFLNRMNELYVQLTKD